MSIKQIEVAKDFSPYPAGRFVTDGDYSGEHFRNNYLVPVLKEEGHARILFDGARGYGSSFLEEAFGGLVRMGYSPDRVKDAFELISSDTSIITEILEYIDDARKQ